MKRGCVYMNEIFNVDGVECYEKDGTAYLKLETVARGLGFTTIAASGNKIVRWNTVYGYLSDLKVVAGSCNGNYRENCPEFIPENIFYRLAMKAKNETAEKFQAKVADKKIQYKINDTWVMYSQYSNLGYEEIKQEVLDNGKVIYHRRITQIGREFILNLFKK